MGRGRQKAKQTKVARDLKYQTLDTDFGALARELHGSEGASGAVDDDPDESGAVIDDDKWADYRS